MIRKGTNLDLIRRYLKRARRWVPAEELATEFGWAFRSRISELKNREGFPIEKRMRARNPVGRRAYQVAEYRLR